MTVDPLEDGTKHINISHQAKTPLGRMLSPPFESKFELPDDGSFRSVGGYWHWLLFGPEEGFREVSGEEVFLRGKFDDAVSQAQTREFQEKILRATWHKIRQNDNIFWRFQGNILPYRRYYVTEGKVVYPLDRKWMCEGIEVMTEYIDHNFW